MEGETIDFGNCQFDGGKFHTLSLADTAVANIRLVDCQVDYLDITDAEPKGITVSESVIVRLAGITSSDHAPTWLTDCLVEAYQSLGTLSAIREAGLSVSQTFLLSSLRKLFLQPGGGRRESSMYKGYGDAATKKTCEKVIHLLVREGFCSKFKGESESLYIPNRSYTGRVQAIMNQLTTSRDDLWSQATRIA
jgi:hypothetical protein